MYKAKCEVCQRPNQNCEITSQLWNGLQFAHYMCLPCFGLLKETALTELRAVHAKAFKEITDQQADQSPES